MRRDEAALHQIDQHGSEPGLDHVRAEPPDDRRDRRARARADRVDHRLEIGGGEDVGQRLEPAARTRQPGRDARSRPRLPCSAATRAGMSARPTGRTPRRASSRRRNYIVIRHGGTDPVARLRLRLRPPRRTDRPGCRRRAGLAAAGGRARDRRDAPRAVGGSAAFLRAGDLLVVNDTRVFAARLLGRRVPSGGAVECLLLSRPAPCRRRVDLRRADASGTEAEARRDRRSSTVDGPAWRCRRDARAQVLRPATDPVDRRDAGLRSAVAARVDVAGLIDRLGHMPLPPYIRRADTPATASAIRPSSRTRRRRSPRRRRACTSRRSCCRRSDSRGIERTAITLHVGYGTFKPVRADRVEDHVVDPEHYDIERRRGQGHRIARSATGGASSRSARPRRARWRTRSARGAGESSPRPRDRLDVHLPGFRVPGRRCADDELPPAAIVAADARRSLRRPGADAGRVPGRGRGALPVLQLRRRDADRVKHVARQRHSLQLPRSARPKQPE